MKAIKNFFNQRKTELKFARLGDGQKLTDQQRDAAASRQPYAGEKYVKPQRRPPADGSKRAAEAALDRIERVSFYLLVWARLRESGLSNIGDIFGGI